MLGGEITRMLALRQRGCCRTPGVGSSVVASMCRLASANIGAPGRVVSTLLHSCALAVRQTGSVCSFGCVSLASRAQHLLARPPPWAGTGNMRVALNLFPISMETMLLWTSRLYVAYRAQLAARHQGRILRPGQAEQLLRATLRSLCDPFDCV